MPPAVALLHYKRSCTCTFSRTVISRGLFSDVYVSLLSLHGRNGEDSMDRAVGAQRSFFAHYWASKDECAQRTGAHWFFILVSYILLAKLYSPHEVHSHCLFMQSGILMLFLFQRKEGKHCKIKASFANIRLANTPPPTFSIVGSLCMYSIQYVYKSESDYSVCLQWVTIAATTFLIFKRRKLQGQKSFSGEEYHNKKKEGRNIVIAWYVRKLKKQFY